MSRPTRTGYPPAHPVHAAVQLVGGGLLLALALCAIGWVIVRLEVARALVAWDESVVIWVAARRTPALDMITDVGSSMADTTTCIALLVVMVVVTRLWLGRWREAGALMAALVGELLVFLIVTAVVQRDRPDVIQLDLAPPTSSFPSGHTAAAVALYGCIAVIVNREMRTRWLAVPIVAACWAVPVIVGVARTYRGMHFPTDVIFGFVGGGLWLTIAVLTVLPLARGRSADGLRTLPGPTGGPLERRSVPASMRPLGRWSISERHQSSPRASSGRCESGTAPQR